MQPTNFCPGYTSRVRIRCNLGNLRLISKRMCYISIVRIGCNQGKEQAVTLHLACAYKIQPTFIATIIIAMASLHLYRVYNMKH